jgi:hypothetical protein
MFIRKQSSPCNSLQAGGKKCMREPDERILWPELDGFMLSGQQKNFMAGEEYV